MSKDSCWICSIRRKNVIVRWDLIFYKNYLNYSKECSKEPIARTFINTENNRTTEKENGRSEEKDTWSDQGSFALMNGKNLIRKYKNYPSDSSG